MVSANNIDQEWGWCREEFKKIGVGYAVFRHAPENNWYPHYIHNLDNLIPLWWTLTRESTSTLTSAATVSWGHWVYEGGCMGRSGPATTSSG